jgi:hypothetical protein
MVCGEPPAGQARWSVRLIVEQALKRKLVPKLGRETVRILLQDHDSKPWREKRCGAFRNSTRSTSSGWRRCRKYTKDPIIRRNQWFAWMKSRCFYTAKSGLKSGRARGPYPAGL